MNSPSFSNHSHFQLFSNCLPVKGVKRSVICDLQRNSFDFIPNDFHDFLVEYNGCQIGEIKKDFDDESQAVINEYFIFLEEKGYIFFCDQEELDWFPPLDLKWQSPSIIENAIIDIDKDSNHDYKNIILQLEELGCIAIEFRFFTKQDIQSLDKLLQLTQGSRIESINIIFPYSSELDLSFLEKLMLKFQRISSLLIHSYPVHKKEELNKLNPTLLDKLDFTAQVIDSSNHCGFISPLFFRLNVKSYSETKSYNNCLNKKISIDISGEIKNCPAFPKSYGNIKNISFEEALNIEGFKEMWTITKDQIEVCKSCEFRYMCSDCRAFTENENDLFSKPLKCSYNPETTLWEN